VADGLRAKSESCRCIRLGIAVNNEHRFPSLCQKAGNIEAGGRFTRTAFMVRKGNDRYYIT
jgi:hypothetical protein